MDNQVTFCVGICDDEIEWRRAISDSCKKFFSNNNLEANIFYYSNGEQLLSDWNREIDLLFLDVEMESMDGLSVMKEVEKLPNIHSIIFVSSHSEAVWNSFGYKTKGFITKPFIDEDIWFKLSNIYNKKATDSVIKLSDFNGVVYINKADIVLLKADSNYVTIYTENCEKVITCKLKECEKKLGGIPFVRIHKSYIVNLEYVSNISSNYVYFKNGDTCNIGRSYKDIVKKSYQDYLLRELHK